MEHTFILHPTDILHVLGCTMVENPVAHTAISMNNGEVSLLAFIVFVIVLFLIFIIKSLKNLVFRHLKYSAIAVWFSGVILYIIGFNEHGCEWNWLALILRASLSSVEMFVSHSDLLEVEKSWHHSALYMTFFSIIHFLAVLISAIFIVKTFGLKIKTWFRKFWWRFNSTGTLYVFSGKSSASLFLIKQVSDNIKKKNEKGRIVYIYDAKSEHSTSSLSGLRYSFSHLMGHRLVDNSFEELVVEDWGGIILSSSTQTLCSVLKKIPRKETKYIFLSDNEKENIDSYKDMLNVGLLDDVTVTCYCHAARTAENKALIKIRPKNEGKDSVKMGPNLYLIDSSYLSIRELKQIPLAHPVNFVNIQKGGIVADPFNSLVIGFGETGKEAMSFLYEFSAFLGTDDLRSPYKLIAIDSNMDQIKGGYYAQRPALESNGNLELHKAYVNSGTYWDIVTKIISRGLNYVIISLGNDELNIKTALELYEYVMRYAINVDGKFSYNHGKFVIYVKVLDNRYEYLRDEVYDANVIRFYGKEELIFTKDNVFNEKHEEKAQIFEKAYIEAKSQNDKNKTKTEIEILRKTERSVSQNLSNSYHGATKIKLLTAGIPEESHEAFLKRLSSMKRVPEDIKDFEGTYWYEENKVRQDDETLLMTNIAKCEHLRWNAAIEMLGYEKNEDDCFSCCEFVMKHNCLTTWDGLHQIWLKSLLENKTDKEYKRYDYDTVEKSIQLYLKEKGDN